MNYVHALFLVAFLYLNTVPQNAVAQNATATQSRFKASLLTGINFSQIHGDLQDGYKRKGLSVGLAGGFMLSRDWDIRTELLYNEKGTSSDNASGLRPDKYYSNISLKYSEMVLLAHHYFKPQNDKNYYKQSLSFGFSYGRLLKSQTSVVHKTLSVPSIEQTLTQNYNRDDFSMVVAWAYHFSPRLSVSIRHTNTLNFLFTGSPSFERNTFENMRPYFFSYHLNYDIIAPKSVPIPVKRKKGRTDPLEEL